MTWGDIIAWIVVIIFAVLLIWSIVGLVWIELRWREYDKYHRGEPNDWLYHKDPWWT